MTTNIMSRIDVLASEADHDELINYLDQIAWNFNIHFGTLVNYCDFRYQQSQQLYDKVRMLPQNSIDMQYPNAFFMASPNKKILIDTGSLRYEMMYTYLENQDIKRMFSLNLPDFNVNNYAAVGPAGYYVKGGNEYKSARRIMNNTNSFLLQNPTRVIRKKSFIHWLILSYMKILNYKCTQPHLAITPNVSNIQYTYFKEYCIKDRPRGNITTDTYLYRHVIRLAQEFIFAWNLPGPKQIRPPSKFYNIAFLAYVAQYVHDHLNIPVAPTSRVNFYTKLYDHNGVLPTSGMLFAYMLYFKQSIDASIDIPHTSPIYLFALSVAEILVANPLSIDENSPGYMFALAVYAESISFTYPPFPPIPAIFLPPANYNSGSQENDYIRDSANQVGLAHHWNPINLTSPMMEWKIIKIHEHIIASNTANAAAVHPVVIVPSDSIDRDIPTNNPLPTDASACILDFYNQWAHYLETFIEINDIHHIQNSLLYEFTTKIVESQQNIFISHTGAMGPGGNPYVLEDDAAIHWLYVKITNYISGLPLGLPPNQELLLREEFSTITLGRTANLHPIGGINWWKMYDVPCVRRDVAVDPYSNNIITGAKHAADTAIRGVAPFLQPQTIIQILNRIEDNDPYPDNIGPPVSPHQFTPYFTVGMAAFAKHVADAASGVATDIAGNPVARANADVATQHIYIKSFERPENYSEIFSMVPTIMNPAGINTKFLFLIADAKTGEAGKICNYPQQINPAGETHIYCYFSAHTLADSGVTQIRNTSDSVAGLSTGHIDNYKHVVKSLANRTVRKCDNVLMLNATIVTRYLNPQNLPFTDNEVHQSITFQGHNDAVTAHDFDGDPFLNKREHVKDAIDLLPATDHIGKFYIAQRKRCGDHLQIHDAVHMPEILNNDNFVEWMTVNGDNNGANRSKGAGGPPYFPQKKKIWNTKLNLTPAVIGPGQLSLQGQPIFGLLDADQIRASTFYITGDWAAFLYAIFHRVNAIMNVGQYSIVAICRE